MIKYLQIFTFFTFYLITSVVNAQNWSDSLGFYFKPTNNYTLDFDERIPLKINKNHFPTQHIAVAKNETTTLLFSIRDTNKRQLSKLKFSIEHDDVLLNPYKINDSLYSLQLPKSDFNYFVTVSHSGIKTLQLEVVPLEQKREKIIIVPLTSSPISSELLAEELNKIYLKANVSFDISIQKKFQSKDFNATTIFSNPILEHKRYTQQMRTLRNAYFKTHKNRDKKAYYVFIVDGFLDTNLWAYMPTNKAFLLAKHSNSPDFYYQIARELGFGVGSFTPFLDEKNVLLGKTLNVMDTTRGYELNPLQWQLLQQSAHSFQFYDEDENVRTNNGLVAYYFWEEDKDGFIKLGAKNPLSTIHRPYKKNYRSYHLNIEDYFFQIVFRIAEYKISLWHLISLVIVFLSWFISRKLLNRKIVQNEKVKNHWRRPLKFLLILGFIFSYILIFIWLNYQLTNYEIRSGKIKDFNGMSYSEVRQSILSDKELAHENEDVLTTQLIINRNDQWYVKERKQVLYFSIFKNKDGKWDKAKFSHDADSLILSTENFSTLAESHYIVFNYLDSLGECTKQRVFNHVGIDITKKLIVEDDAKRILLFVNGYRPTSIGKTFEDNFSDIKRFGLEHPDSKNLIYDFDRYDYWRPWREIDLLFQQRLNPTATYYADGHHSVSTSNHESLLKFSSNSTIYPKRCKNMKKHTCHTTEIAGSGFFSSSTKQKTMELLATTPNKKGFDYRKNQGKIAGKNLLMMLNELPSRIDNDTLYLVAHSMGFAYSLGIVEELRGKINFGGFYILAPENGESGLVNKNEWQQIWHYGSNLIGKYPDYPCLQDGVAPQSKVKGLTKKQMIFIPPHLSTSKGYFDAHFIGYYTWVFDIPKNSKGHILQR